MIIKDDIITYSCFEVEAARILMGRAGQFSMTTEPIHERKALWDMIQELKRMARAETPEMAGEV